MDICVTGLNHKAAPVELREKLAVGGTALPAMLSAVRDGLRASEAVVLSTCNRVEVWTVHDGPAPVPDDVSRFLAARHGVPAEALSPAVYRHEGPEAVRHLFRVASGLDSMVLGEAQILGQVKDAYQAAQESGATGRVFNRLFQRAAHVAGRVRSTTRVGERNVSVPSVASKLAEKVFQDLSAKALLVLGAGEMGELTVGAFRNRGVTRLHVANRTLENARALAERCGGTAHALDELAGILPQGDVVIACVRSDTYVLGVEQVEAALAARRQEPMVLMDLAVPRNIHPEVNKLENVYLFDIDDLQAIVQQNVLERQREVERCAPLIEEETQGFLKDFTPPDVTRLLAQLREKLHALGDEEARRTLTRLNGLSSEQREEVTELVRRIINKVLHPPSEALRGDGLQGPDHSLIELVRKLFGINK
jgi:glutamyl-tRNA reductase